MSRWAPYNSCTALQRRALAGLHVHGRVQGLPQGSVIGPHTFSPLCTATVSGARRGVARREGCEGKARANARIIMMMVRGKPEPQEG